MAFEIKAEEHFEIHQDTNNNRALQRETGGGKSWYEIPWPFKDLVFHFWEK
jgi:hypothetical protein